MTDPRIEAAALALCGPDHKADRNDPRPCLPCITEAEGALAAADAVDPLRNPPNRAGIAPAGTPTKRIWPDD